VRLYNVKLHSTITIKKYNIINVFNRVKGSALAKHYAGNYKRDEIINKMFVILHN